ncbi:palmitoyltransferase ZDHHC15B-like isoform X2 [Xenia sp. Carnegie-2017]|uniref:palmitoyltransferase ZDHHC15B-like isoform X2 n=1 Tax=Xenia sp. Carnegie-2017 TaxID=2897299 RepID=UPI001F03EBBB|nr:palmitoyltransferase ZDHHC15B-like isoform X2 [Xenia sp. Carnegie-2017]
MGKLIAFIEGLIKLAQWLPVIVIFSIVLWSYYAYNVILCIETVDNYVEKAVYIVFYHVFFILFVWSYWKTIITSPGRIPLQFYLSPSDRMELEEAENPNLFLENFARKLPVQTLTQSNTIRFCDSCYAIKPDRSHHCSMCKTCRLKMDHHCPWVNNCVGFKNYKFFLLFLFHAILYTFFVAMTSLQYFIKVWMHITKGGYHIYLVMVNRTTLESMRAPVFREGGADKHGFNLGTWKNIKQVFGNRRWLWCFPVYTSLGDGVVYPLREECSPEQMDLLNERTKWLNDESDDDEDHKTYTNVDIVDETAGSERIIEMTPNVVTLK